MTSLVSEILLLSKQPWTAEVGSRGLTWHACAPFVMGVASSVLEIFHTFFSCGVFDKILKEILIIIN